jgi:hypothetical protein
MNKAGGFVDRIKFGVGVALLVALTGCVGYVGPGGGPDVVVGGPDVVVGGPWYGGVFEHGYVGRGDARGYGGRGAASRAVAHGGGGRGGGRR